MRAGAGGGASVIEDSPTTYAVSMHASMSMPMGQACVEAKRSGEGSERKTSKRRRAAETRRVQVDMRGTSFHSAALS